MAVLCWHPRVVLKAGKASAKSVTGSVLHFYETALLPYWDEVRKRSDMKRAADIASHRVITSPFMSYRCAIGCSRTDAHGHIWTSGWLIWVHGLEHADTGRLLYLSVGESQSVHMLDTASGDWDKRVFAVLYGSNPPLISALPLLNIIKNEKRGNEVTCGEVPCYQLFRRDCHNETLPALHLSPLLFFLYTKMRSLCTGRPKKCFLQRLAIGRGWQRKTIMYVGMPLGATSSELSQARNLQLMKGLECIIGSSGSGGRLG